MTTITRDQKIKLFRRAYELKLEGDAYIDPLPTEFKALIFDNGYSASQGMMNDLLQDVVFGKDRESVYWFLYEWHPGYEVGCNGKTVKINNIDEYIDWIVTEEGFGE